MRLDRQAAASGCRAAPLDPQVCAFAIEACSHRSGPLGNFAARVPIPKFAAALTVSCVLLGSRRRPGQTEIPMELLARQLKRIKPSATIAVTDKARALK